jgi:hypothetical protein
MGWFVGFGGVKVFVRATGLEIEWNGLGAEIKYSNDREHV